MRRSEPRRASTGELGVDSAPLDGPEFEAGGDGGARLLQLPPAGEWSRNCGNFNWKPEKSEPAGDEDDDDGDAAVGFP